MTETQGDYLGCIVVLIGLVPLLVAVERASRGRIRMVRGLIAVSVLCSFVGVATVILT